MNYNRSIGSNHFRRGILRNTSLYQSRRRFHPRSRRNFEYTRLSRNQVMFPTNERAITPINVEYIILSDDEEETPARNLEVHNLERVTAPPRLHLPIGHLSSISRKIAEHKFSQVSLINYYLTFIELFPILCYKIRWKLSNS